jgi:hypothetical protein
MADVTPVYDLPYQELGDAPDGPALGEDLALAVETELIRIDAAVAAINGMAPASVSSTTDEIGFTSTSFVAGASPVGVAFTAPPSGAVLIHLSAIVSQNINTQATFVSCEVKTGGTIGSGTLFGSAANSDRGLTVGRAINSGAVALLQASRAILYTGLTASSTYNVRVMHCVDGGSGSLFFRELIVVPML